MTSCECSIEDALANYNALGEHQDEKMPKLVDIKAAEQKMHERNILHSDW